MKPDPLAVPIPEAARLLGIGRSKTYLLIEEDRLETIHIGSRRLVLYESLRDYVEQRRKAGP